MPTRTNFPLRKIVLALGAAEALIGLAFVLLMLQASDPLSQAIGQGMARLAALPVLICVVPGLALGLANRWLPAALMLLVSAVPTAWALWRFA